MSNPWSAKCSKQEMCADVVFLITPCLLCCMQGLSVTNLMSQRHYGWAGRIKKARTCMQQDEPLALTNPADSK